MSPVSHWRRRVPSLAQPGVASTGEPAQFTSLRYGERLAEIGVTPSIGTVGDSYDNALAETVNGYDKAEPIRRPARPGPWRSVEDVELATLGWVRWHNHQRLHGYLGDLPPVEFGGRFYATTQGHEALVEITSPEPPSGPGRFTLLVTCGFVPVGRSRSFVARAWHGLWLGRVHGPHSAHRRQQVPGGVRAAPPPLSSLHDDDILRRR
jgi:hypothetical protein